jgi:hypothetical protein
MNLPPCAQQMMDPHWIVVHFDSAICRLITYCIFNTLDRANTKWHPFSPMVPLNNLFHLKKIMTRKSEPMLSLPFFMVYLHKVPIP